MFYDSITAVKVLQLVGHFAYLVKNEFDYDPGTKFEFNIPFNCTIARRLDDIKALQDILDISDICFQGNILSVETKVNIPFARIVFTDGFTIEDLLKMYPELKLPPCPVCNKTGYHIPGSYVCYADDFSYHYTDCGCECK